MDAVWVVDDDQSIRWVLERALSKEGFAVQCLQRRARSLVGVRPRDRAWR